MTRPHPALRGMVRRSSHAPHRLLLCALLLWLIPPLAAAQSDADATRAASARAFFEEGVRLAEQGDWADAEDRFRRALALRSSPVIAYNLASALAERGKLVEASETARRALGDDNVDPELRQSAARLLEDLQQRIAHLAVDVRGWQPGDAVLLDGRPLLDAQLRIEIPIDPGHHELRLERAGGTAALASVSLAPGERRRAALSAPALQPSRQALAQAAGPAEPAPLTEAPAASDGGSLFGRWWFWTGAAAVVGAGVLVAVLATRPSPQTESAYQGNVPPGSIRVEVSPR